MPQKVVFGRSCIVVAFVMSASMPHASAFVVGPGAFTSNAQVESFEGIGYVSMFGLLPLDFGSGVKLTGGAYPDSSGAYIVDFSPPSGFFGFSTAAHIPHSTAFLGHANSGLNSTIELTFDAPKTRVGGYITSSDPALTDPFILSAYDSGGNFLESATINPVPSVNWGTNFLGIQNPAGIRSITLKGLNLTNSVMLDKLTFEAVPEPSTLLLLSTLALVPRLRRHRSSVDRNLASTAL